MIPKTWTGLDSLLSDSGLGFNSTPLTWHDIIFAINHTPLFTYVKQINQKMGTQSCLFSHFCLLSIPVVVTCFSVVFLPFALLLSLLPHLADHIRHSELHQVSRSLHWTDPSYRAASLTLHFPCNCWKAYLLLVSNIRISRFDLQLIPLLSFEYDFNTNKPSIQTSTHLL